jgi:sigma-B regulation protein RsbU (phosphoserine phosphatase)
MSKRILIVDDERLVGTLLAHTLDDMEDFGVELLVVDDPAAAVESCGGASPDLAFVDADMPGMTGLELCAALRQVFPGEQLSLILLVEKGASPDADRCADLRLVECVEKPFDPDRIRALACAALGFEFEG